MRQAKGCPFLILHFCWTLGEGGIMDSFDWVVLMFVLENITPGGLAEAHDLAWHCWIRMAVRLASGRWKHGGLASCGELPLLCHGSPWIQEPWAACPGQPLPSGSQRSFCLCGATFAWQGLVSFLLSWSLDFGMNNGTCAWKRHNIVSCFMLYILWDDCPSPNPGPGWMDQRLPCFRDSLRGSSESGSCGGGRFQKVGGNVLHHSLLETP